MLGRIEICGLQPCFNLGLLRNSCACNPPDGSTSGFGDVASDHNDVLRCRVRISQITILPFEKVKLFCRKYGGLNPSHVLANAWHVATLEVNLRRRN